MQQLLNTSVTAVKQWRSAAFGKHILCSWYCVFSSNNSQPVCQACNSNNAYSRSHMLQQQFSIMCTRQQRKLFNFVDVQFFTVTPYYNRLHTRIIQQFHGLGGVAVTLLQRAVLLQFFFSGSCCCCCCCCYSWCFGSRWLHPQHNKLNQHGSFRPMAESLGVCINTYARVCTRMGCLQIKNRSDLWMHQTHGLRSICDCIQQYILEPKFYNL